ncbi:MAG: thioesterase family protein [Desulfobacteraceae bacterium]|nr:thioesterase family protein [Desulfobacteraceae bacterium]MBC2754875.1 thioesterase family protein [Desulfobacteraceae bacterium]
MSDQILLKESVLDSIREYFNNVIPFNTLVGLNVTKMTPEVVEVHTAMRQELIGNTVQNILHGGVVATLLDVAGGLVAMAQSIEKLDDLSKDNVWDRLKHVGTIDLRIDYLLPGRGEEFFAYAYVIRHGKKVAVSRMELENEKGRQLAVGSGTYIVG